MHMIYWTSMRELKEAVMAKLQREAVRKKVSS